jgi:site-specific recombinase XerD
VALYERNGIWYCDVFVGGRRIRKSTKQSNEKRAIAAAALIIAKLETGSIPVRKARRLSEIGEAFMKWVDTAEVNGRLSKNGSRYYRNGWRLLRQSKLAGMRIDQITNDDVVAYGPTGQPYTVNNAIRTLRRILSKCQERDLIAKVPKLSTVREMPREVIYSKQQEDRLLALAPQPLHDVAMIIFDTGMRPEEVFRMQVRHIDFMDRSITVEKGKTEKARRSVPLSDRCMEMLKVRVMGRGTEAWVFPSARAHAGHVVTVEKQFLAVRQKMGLDKRFVLYSARHTFGTHVGSTGNLKLAMVVLGHSDVRTAMRYMDPETELIREIINQKNAPVEQLGLTN